MAVLLLRTLTRKSVIGFGLYKELTVQNVIDMCRVAELLSIYYTCRNIDFNQDLKDEFCIFGEREIDKKKPLESRYIANSRLYVKLCMRDMIDKKDEQTQQKERGINRKLAFENRRRFKVKEKVLEGTIFSKRALQARNHGHYKKG